MKILFKVFTIMLVALLIVACNSDVVIEPETEHDVIDITGVEDEFVQLAENWAESLISNDFEYAIEMPYYKDDHEYIRGAYRAQLENEGTIMVGYEIYGVEQVSERVLQLDGILISVFDDYQEIFIPFYFYLDGEWHYAMNEFEVPEGYLEGLEYKSFENSLDPDDTTIYEVG